MASGADSERSPITAVGFVSPGTTLQGSNLCTASIGVDYVGPHWSKHLKCQVCFGYLQQPHTLTCGHSFCSNCLVRMAQTAKTARRDISVRNLRLPCPTCRALFPASPFLRGHASTTFLVQSLVSDWKKERKRLRSSSTVTLRSICTQTANRTYRLRRRKSPNSAEQNLQEEFHVRLKADDYYIQSMAAAASDSSEDPDSPSKPPPPLHSLRAASVPDPSADSSETSTVSSASSTGLPLGFGRRFRDLERRPVAGVRARLDWTPGRVMLMSVWCMYSVAVVGIAQTTLPYMLLVTLFVLLAILK